MPDTFAPAIPPQEGPSGDGRFLVSKIQFGEGYTGRLGDGLNDDQQNWPLTFVGTNAEITPILQFVRDHKGYISFYWTPPFGVQGRYVVETYTLIPEAASNAKLSFILTQVFHP